MPLHISFVRIAGAYLLAAVTMSPGVKAQGDSLTLGQAEALALQSDPVIMQMQARTEALAHNAVAEGQLPDPELSVGLAEIPLNNFDLGDHEDTEVRLGLSQAFPPGRTLTLRSARMDAMAGAERARVANRRLEVLNRVRSAYVILYYEIAALRVLEQNRDLFQEMVDVTAQHYQQGRGNQQDVTRAQLELSLIEDRIAQGRGAIEVGRAELEKWIGQIEARRPLGQSEPSIPLPRPPDAIIEGLPGHPLLRAEDGAVETARQSVLIAREQYKPRFMVDFMITENTGSAFDLQTGPDFTGVFLRMSLPLFPDKRQDRRLAANQQEVLAARFGRADRLRELVREVNAQHADLERLERRLELYDRRAIAEAAQTQSAAFNAYQNDLVDFESLVRARALALETELQVLRLKSQRMQRRIALNYLAGESL